LLVRLLALTRIAVLCQAVSALVLQWHSMQYPAVVSGLLVVLAVENAALIASHLRRGVLNSRCLAIVDVCSGMAALVIVVALLKPTANPDTDNILYPYTVTTIAVIGLTFRRACAPAAAATLAAAAYMAATLWRFGAAPGRALLVNAITYGAWGMVSWFLAARFRALSAHLDQARRAAVSQEAQLARERERSRHARELHAIRTAAARRELKQEQARARLSRALHDHVLQTLEFMGRDCSITDPQLRDHVAAEAVWLRELVCGELDRRAEGLSAALGRVAERQARAGMQIELNTSGAGGESLPEDAIMALAGAVSELLTNVRKHAGTNRAVVRAIAAAGQVTVTVLDHGRGLDFIKVTGGLGLRESVISRVQEAGGHVVVTSEPGAGTHVEMTVPQPMPAPREGNRPGAVPQSRTCVPEGCPRECRPSDAAPSPSAGA
jgi:signal transduction histidine kinase